MKDANHHLTYFDKLVLAQGSDLQDDKGRYKGIAESSMQAYNLNPYHLESDVFTHTLMVCKQAENASYEVKIAALLHDIGKPSTRAVNPKNGRVSFYNHDAVSAFMSLEILKREELGLSKKQQSHIFNLIALHTQIYKLSVEQLAAIGNRELVSDLIELGKADHAGRFHTAGDAVIPSIEDIPFRDKEELEFEKEVVVLVGLPGSGKSSYIQNNYAGTSENFQAISRDYFIENQEGSTYNEKWKNTVQKDADSYMQRCFKEAKEWQTATTLVDMTHMSKKSRRRTLSHFDKSYKRKAVVFLTDLVTNNLRNSQREGKTIDNSVIQKMMRSFYPPCFSEFDEIEYVL
jgi:putative nucleotidyltransferase with HDIG domain